MSEKLRKYLTVLLVAVFVVSTGLLIKSKLDKKAAGESYLQAQQIAGLSGETVTAETDATEQTLPTVPETQPTVPLETQPQTVWVPAAVEPDEHMENLAQIDLNALRKANPDVVGWIFLPGSQVNYPIVQGEDNQYYLEHTWDNKKNSAGSIFLEATNSPNLTDCRSVLYGHNMGNMSMFAILHAYANSYYVKQFPYAYLVTDEGVLRYEIYSTYQAAVDSKTYALDLDHRHMPSFIQMTLDESEFDMGIVPADTDRILTLSTCTGNYSTRRVVHARLVMEEVEVKNDPLPTESGSESVG